LGGRQIKIQQYSAGIGVDFDQLGAICSEVEIVAEKGTSWPKILAGGSGGSGQYCVTIGTIVRYCLYGANKLLHFLEVPLP
jgi:hypothetical protein